MISKAPPTGARTEKSFFSEPNVWIAANARQNFSKTDHKGSGDDNTDTAGIATAGSDTSTPKVDDTSEVSNRWKYSKRRSSADENEPIRRRRGRGPGIKLSNHLDRAMEQAGKSAGTATPAAPQPTGNLTADIIDLVYAIQNRTAVYQWPPAARALEKGKPVNLTRKGRRMFLLFKRDSPRSVDFRAVEVEIARRSEIFSNNGSGKDTKPEKEGLTIAEAAQLLNVDRGSLSSHLVEIPLGEAPPLLPVGKVPCRRIGNVRRIFREDLFVVTQRKRNQHEHPSTQTDSVPADRPNWHRSLNQLFES